MNQIDKFLAELAERENQRQVSYSDNQLESAALSQAAIESLTEAQVYQHVKTFRGSYGHREIRRKCRRHSQLVVRKIGKVVVVGSQDRDGQLIIPSPIFSYIQLKRFMREMAGQWVIIPWCGGKVHWKCYHSPESEEYTIHPVMDFIDLELLFYPSQSLLNLNRLIIAALGLYPITMSKIER